jgi:hypothetical protein
VILTIRVDALLRDAVASPYRMLVTRPTGAAVRGRIQAVLAASDCEAALLDFSAVELLDLSCADEVVAKLLAAADTACRYVLLGGLCENQREAIEHVLRNHRLAVAVVLPAAARPALLGWVTDDLRAAFDAVCSADAPVDAATVATGLGWSAARAAETLETLAEHRVVREAGGRYRPLPVPFPTNEAA